MSNFPLQSIEDVGSVGINKDIPDILLDNNIWSDGRNIRFDNESVSKIKGEKVILDTGLEVVNTLVWWPQQQSPNYTYGNGKTLYKWNGDEKVAYTFNPEIEGLVAANQWTATIAGGGQALILNNGLTTPIVSFANSTSTNEFIPLPGWPEGWVAGVIRANESYLVAGNLSQVENNKFVKLDPAVLAISSGAAPGAIPDNWTIGITGRQTTPYVDTFSLSSGAPIREIVGLRGKLMVFTDDSVYAITPQAAVTGPTGADLINQGKGVLATNCAIEFDGNVFAVDKNDIYTTNGSGGITSVANTKVKDYFFKNLNKVYHHNTHCIKNLPEDEIWICYPKTYLLVDGKYVENTTGLVNEAIIWNYLLKTWSLRDLANVDDAVLGPTLIASASEAGPFFELGEEKITMTSYIDGDTKKYNVILTGDADDVWTFNKEPFHSYVERNKLRIGEIDRHHWTGSVYPVMSGTDTMTIRMKGQDTPGEDVDLMNDKNVSIATFDIQKDYKVDPTDQGRILNIRFESTSDQPWTLASYALAIKDTFQR